MLYMQLLHYSWFYAAYCGAQSLLRTLRLFLLSALGFFLDAFHYFYDTSFLLPFINFAELLHWSCCRFV